MSAKSPTATCTTRLQIALQAGGVGAPDLVDLEQGRFGGFLRGGGDPGLVDLTDRLKEGGYMKDLVAARQALYSYKGKTYGIEHALTPVRALLPRRRLRGRRRRRDQGGDLGRLDCRRPRSRCVTDDV